MKHRQFVVAIVMAGSLFCRPASGQVSPNRDPNLWVGLNETEMTVEGTTITLISLSGGDFQMGSINGHVSQKPVTLVTLSPFWIGKTEITQQQWESIMSSNPSKHKGPNIPVHNLTWNEAISFCERLTLRQRRLERISDRYEYSLPTEAEWEYACRAGSKDSLTADLESKAWYAANSGGKIHPVAKKNPNAWGIFDMDGNVAEMCLDIHPSFLPGGHVVDPKGFVPATPREATEKNNRSVRGSTALTDNGKYDFLKLTERSDSVNPYSDRSNFVGFRIVLRKTGSSR